GYFLMPQPNHNQPSGQIPEVRIGSKTVGSGRPCYVVAEIGINHNGDIDLVYTQEELAKPRESPFGNTNGDLKRGLEFGREEFEELDRYCREVKIDWFASCWDEASVDFIAQFKVPCFKIASASITD